MKNRSMYIFREENENYIIASHVEKCPNFPLCDTFNISTSVFGRCSSCFEGLKSGRNLLVEVSTANIMPQERHVELLPAYEQITV